MAEMRSGIVDEVNLDTVLNLIARECVLAFTSPVSLNIFTSR
jgi:hypothetical protein